MNIPTFIEKALKNETKRDWTASVMQATDFDGVTTVYSYGYHYPLVKIIDGMAFVNNRGYSNTTSKHIGHAFYAAAKIVGYDNVYGVELQGSLEKHDILKSATAQVERIKAEMDAKKRKDTFVYQSLESELERAERTLKAAKAL